MHFSIDRTVHTTAFDKPVVDHCLERKIAQTAAGSTEKDRSDSILVGLVGMFANSCRFENRNKSAKADFFVYVICDSVEKLHIFKKALMTVFQERRKWFI